MVKNRYVLFKIMVVNYAEANFFHMRIIAKLPPLRQLALLGERLPIYLQKLDWQNEGIPAAKQQQQQLGSQYYQQNLQLTRQED